MLVLFTKRFQTQPIAPSPFHFYHITNLISKFIFYIVTDKRGVNNGSRILIIIFSVIGAIIVVCFSLYCFWCRKRVRKGNYKEKTMGGVREGNLLGAYIPSLYDS